MTAPQPDVPANQRFDKIKNRVGEQKLQQARVPEMDGVKPILAILFQVFLKDGFQARKFLRREDRLMVKNITFAVIMSPPVLA